MLLNPVKSNLKPLFPYVTDGDVFGIHTPFAFVDPKEDGVRADPSIKINCDI